jgi:hypothetical protein
MASDTTAPTPFPAAFCNVLTNEPIFAKFKSLVMFASDRPSSWVTSEDEDNPHKTKVKKEDDRIAEEIAVICSEIKNLSASDVDQITEISDETAKSTVITLFNKLGQTGNSMMILRFIKVLQHLEPVFEAVLRKFKASENIEEDGTKKLIAAIQSVHKEHVPTSANDGSWKAMAKHVESVGGYQSDDDY